MREYIRLRRLALATMLTTNDYFRRDELLMESYSYARKYVQTRLKLTQMNINEQESALHTKLVIATQKSQAFTSALYDDIVTGIDPEQTENINQALNTATEYQAKVMDLLDELVVLQKSYSKNLENEADVAFEKLFVQLSVISVIVFLLSIIIVTIITRYVTFQNTKMQATRAKSDFLAHMSHELRTPLSAVIGFGESLSEDNMAQADIEYAALSIVKAGKHVIRLINDILDISKVEANRMEFELKENNLSDLIDDLHTIVIVLAKNKNLELDIIPVHPLPAAIYTDALRLKQIVLNLCSNAIKFTDHGTIVLTISYNTDTNLLCISVRDPGIGISAEQIDRLFQPFTQAEPYTASKYGGTGLGLYLSKQLAQNMGGEIEISSEVNVGSTFTLTTSVGPQENIRLLNDTDKISKLLEKRTKNLHLSENKTNNTG